MLDSRDGIVKELFYSLADSTRVSTKQLIVSKDGVEGDKFFGKNSQRAILLTSQYSYELASQNRINIDYGSLGENIILDINPYSLHVGSKISIGDVILEVTQNCTICNSLASVDEKLPELLKNDRGIFVKTIKSGTIKQGDKVKFSITATLKTRKTV